MLSRWNFCIPREGECRPTGFESRFVIFDADITQDGRAGHGPWPRSLSVVMSAAEPAMLPGSARLAVVPNPGVRRSGLLT
jgi:hypothetical protein